MKPRLMLALSSLALLAGCGGGGGNESARQANAAVPEGDDLNMAISGDELSPIPEAEDDMIANQSGAANAAAPAPQPAPAAQTR